MQRKTALLIGISFGAGIVAVSLPFGQDPLKITFAACLLLFLYSASHLLLFSLLGWPTERADRLDIYDLNRFVIATCISAGGTAFVTSAAAKLADTVGIGMGPSFFIVSLAIAGYATLCIIFIRMALRKAKASTPAWVRPQYPRRETA